MGYQGIISQLGEASKAATKVILSPGVQVRMRHVALAGTDIQVRMRILPQAEPSKPSQKSALSNPCVLPANREGRWEKMLGRGSAGGP